MKDLIKKIWNWIVSIPQDKLLHLILALLINAYSFAIAYRFIPFWWSILTGFVIALAALIAKEIYDSKHREDHSVEFLDIVYGIAGVILIDLSFIIGVM